MIGVPHLNPKDFQIHRFFFPWHVIYFTFFSHAKWNNFLPNFMKASKIYIVLTYESENNKIYPMWAMFYQWHKILKDLIYLNFLHYSRAFGSYSYILYTIAHKVFVIKILGQKKLFRHSLWILEFIFPLKIKSWIFFKDLV